MQLELIYVYYYCVCSSPYEETRWYLCVPFIDSNKTLIIALFDIKIINFVSEVRLVIKVKVLLGYIPN